ncbi:hypothetical protein M9Y10_020102 [Tritrichomonas musculus]|uniref:Uncharacterized protein n=1 Tax=Tritrichomonas musculus TaxID=1915356 RepID=A0ABR2HFA9_9EUKA
MEEYHLKDFRLIKNKELVEAIRIEQNQKMVEEHFSEKDYSIGKSVRVEIDPEKIGNALSLTPIFRKYKDGKLQLETIAHMVVPIYIPNVQNIKELINILISDKIFRFKLYPPYVLQPLYNSTIEFYRYYSTSILVDRLEKFVNINNDDVIYNILPPEGYSYGAFLIHESYENGHIYKTLFDITDIFNVKMIKTDRPIEEKNNNDINNNKNNNYNNNSNDTNNSIFQVIPNSKKHRIHKKIKKGLIYTKLK